MVFWTQKRKPGVKSAPNLKLKGKTHLVSRGNRFDDIVSVQPSRYVLPAKWKGVEISIVVGKEREGGTACPYVSLRATNGDSK